MPLTSDIGSHSFNLGLEVFRARIAANGRGDITVGGETVSIVYDATDGSFSLRDPLIISPKRNHV